MHRASSPHTETIRCSIEAGTVSPKENTVKLLRDAIVGEKSSKGVGTVFLIDG